MAIDTGRPIADTISTDTPVELRLTGRWTGRLRVTVNGLPVRPTRGDGTLTVTLPVGTSTISIG